LIFDVIFFLFSIAVVKITFIFYCSVFLRANIKILTDKSINSSFMTKKSPIQLNN